MVSLLLFQSINLCACNMHHLHLIAILTPADMAPFKRENLRKCIFVLALSNADVNARIA